MQANRGKFLYACYPCCSCYPWLWSLPECFVRGFDPASASRAMARSTVTDQRRLDRIRAPSGVWPLPGAASNRCRRTWSRFSNLRAHPRSTRRRQSLSARRHTRAGRALADELPKRGRRPLPPVHRRTRRRRHRGHGRLPRGGVRRRRIARRGDAALCAGDGRQGSAVHHAAGVGDRFCQGRRALATARCTPATSSSRQTRRAPLVSASSTRSSASNCARRCAVPTARRNASPARRGARRRTCSRSASSRSSF